MMIVMMMMMMPMIGVDLRSSCPFRKRSLPFLRHFENSRPVIAGVSIKKKTNRNPESNPDLELGPFVSLSLSPLPLHYHTDPPNSEKFKYINQQTVFLNSYINNR